jgi:hypothetical protein
MKKSFRFHQNLLLLVFLLPSVGVMAQTVRYVSPKGRNAGNTCLQPGNPCQTIGYALSVTNAGDVLQLAEGTYTEVNTITRPNLIIQGVGTNKTVIKGSVDTYQAVFTQKANGLTIKNLTLTNDKAMYEGITVNGAARDLKVENVTFANIGSPAGQTTEGGSGYGIRVNNDFEGLEVKFCRFYSAYVGTTSASIGISTRSAAKLSQATIQSSNFRDLYAGFLASASVDGLTIVENAFGPMDPEDAFAGSAGIYMGDLQGSLSNIRIAQNSFTEYSRGVYINNYSAVGLGNSLVSNLEIVQNTFNNSIWSSPVRIITSSGSTIEQLAIENNSFVQTQPNFFTDGLAMIDIRQATRTASQASDNIKINRNCINFSGGPYGKSTWGILLRGQTYKAQIRQNYLSGGKVGGSTPNAPGTSGIVVQTNFAEPFGAMPAGAELDCSNNYINGFENGLVFYDRESREAGGLPSRAKILIQQNELSNNEVAIRTGEVGTGISAPSNWFGVRDTSAIKGTLVLGKVDISPVLLSADDIVPGTCGNGFQPQLQNDKPIVIGSGDTYSARVPSPGAGVGQELRPRVAQNFPNPFSERTVLPFWLPKEEQVWLRVYDISGKLILSRAATFSAGQQQFELDGEQLRQGRLWYYQIGGADWMESKQMVKF